MALSLESMAFEYAKETGCDEATAMQAAFVMSTLLADMVGLQDVGDYFASRALEMDSKKTGETAVRVTDYSHLDHSGRPVPSCGPIMELQTPVGVLRSEY